MHCVTGYYAFGPTTGAALNVTLLSYCGTCCVGVNVDTAAVPDAGVLVDCLRQGFDEVLTLAGEHRPATSPLAESERPATPAADDGGDEGEGPTLRAVH